jgi:hypothetical protein
VGRSIHIYPSENIPPCTNRVVFVIDPPIEIDRNERIMLPCAIIGFMFSWIPLIGFIAYLANLDAPFNSPQSAWAASACFVAGVVALFNIVFWAFFAYNEPFSW